MKLSDTFSPSSSKSSREPARLPSPVVPGDRVGVAALSGPVAPERLEAGLAALTELGFEPVLARNLGCRTGYLAGSDTERVEAFHELAGDPSIRAIVFARGGYGVLRLLGAIDWPLLAAHPRAYVGYSDLTPFLAEIVARLGLVAFQGPMVAADLARGLLDEERRSLLEALAGRFEEPLPVAGWLGADEAVEAPLVGGCLTLLNAVIGTPFEQPLAGGVVFLEDTNEALYRLDRLLLQLELAGRLEGVRGFVVGHFDPHAPLAPELVELLAERLGARGVPVALGVPAGHIAPNRTLPFGARVRLEPGRDLRVVIS